jgi:hypothetical protein
VIASSRRVVTSDLSVWSSIDTSRALQEIANLAHYKRQEKVGAEPSRHASAADNSFSCLPNTSSIQGQTSVKARSCRRRSWSSHLQQFTQATGCRDHIRRKGTQLRRIELPSESIGHREREQRTDQKDAIRRCKNPRANKSSGPIPRPGC